MKLHDNVLQSASGKTVLAQFDSASDAAKFLDKATGANKTASEMRSQGGFFGGAQWSDLPRLFVEGDAETAKRAKGLLDRINATMPATKTRKRVSKPFGRAVTGAYLAGDPMPCRARQTVPADTAPLSIVVNVTSSAMTSASDMEKRGIAVAALVQRVAQHRPVNLYLTGAARAGSGESCAGVAWLVQFPTSPIDTYRLAWLCASQAFARGFGFSVFRSAKQFGKQFGHEYRDVSNESHIGWIGSQAYTNDDGAGTYADDLRKHLGTQLFYVPSAGCYGDKYRQMLNDPVAWINETVESLKTV